MTDLHVAFDSLIGYLVGMALVETVIKPSVVRIAKMFLKKIDESSSVPDFVIPDWIYDELPSEREYDV
jgi:hypothetical protein